MPDLSRLVLLGLTLLLANPSAAARERLSINRGWRFQRFTENPDNITYTQLKDWMLYTSNEFAVDSPHDKPSGTPPGQDVQYVQASFDDSKWEAVNLPHDWAIKGPFNAPHVPGAMGRLPIDGVGWYRSTLKFSEDDADKSIFLDIDGAMSYSAVWLNGELVGGWANGYASYRLDLTPHIKTGEDNVLAIRLDNPNKSSRWYTGAGIYRNVWLTKVDTAHVSQFGTYITTPEVSAESATVDLVVEVENKGQASRKLDVKTEVHIFDAATGKASGEAVATFKSQGVEVEAGSKQSVNGSATVANPQLWGPPPAQKPNLYVAVTTLTCDGEEIDRYETQFGIRHVTYDPNHGISVNGQAVRIQGSCNHHDHGSLGAAFHKRAAQRQLEILRDMGNNALRTSHNPPAPELLDLSDEMGMLVLDEHFDVWNIKKLDNDYNKLFADWHERDLRNLVRRDRNHPSVISWGYGNEVREQLTADGHAIAQGLQDIVDSEDPTRQTTAGMNSAPPGSGVADVVEIIGLNYQGEGHNSTQGNFDEFHSTYPNKMIWTTESASAYSTRGTYLFPVFPGNTTYVEDGDGLDEENMYVSAYELYAAGWGSSADKVFEQQDRHPYVAGEFIWAGFDYLGEPSPFDDARSSYFGSIDLAGFPKDRFYLYQARWRPELPMAHILPHWTWPEREGEVTPVHVFTTGDEAELFVNGKSAGRQKKEEYHYRLRWDNVTYTPGSLRVVAYKDGKQWATEIVRTAKEAKKVSMTADRTTIQGDGYDLSYITVSVVDRCGTVVPRANDTITFSIEGPGEIVSTDNGDPTDMTAFPSLERKAFSGKALVVVRSEEGKSGEVAVSAAAEGLKGSKVVLNVV